MCLPWNHKWKEINRFTRNYSSHSELGSSSGTETVIDLKCVKCGLPKRKVFK